MRWPIGENSSSVNPAASGISATASAALGTTLNIVAHEDDDLLFLSPDLLHAIQAGRTVRTVFLTAGDSGSGPDYWQGREAGVQAAYAQMCGVANNWTQTDEDMAGHLISMCTLSGHPSVSLAFLRLPDGNIDGFGFDATNYESLQKLWTGLIASIHTIDGSSSYSKATLSSTLSSLISSFQPDQINTQDYVGGYGDGDHSDHHTVAYLVQAAAQQYSTPHNLTGYASYPTSRRLANVTGADLIAKQNAFYAYAHYDRAAGGVPEIFPMSWRRSRRFRRMVFLPRSLRSRARNWLKTVVACVLHINTSSWVDMSFPAWLQRQYTVDSRSSEDNLSRIDYTDMNQMTSDA